MTALLGPSDSANSREEWLGCPLTFTHGQDTFLPSPHLHHQSTDDRTEVDPPTASAPRCGTTTQISIPIGDLAIRTAIPMALSLSTATFAFAPTLTPMAPATTVRAAAPAMGLESELGATGPLLPYWDPMGLVSSLFSAPRLPQPAVLLALRAGPHPACAGASGAPGTARLLCTRRPRPRPTLTALRRRLSMFCRARRTPTSSRAGARWRSSTAASR